MTKIFRTGIPWFRSENLKLVGIFAIALIFVFGGAVVNAQQPGKIFRIGFLDSSTASSNRLLVDAFRQELSKLGLTEGKNITIEYRYAEGKRDRFPELAAEMVRLQVDLTNCGRREWIGVSRQERHNYDAHSGDERWGSFGYRFGC